MEVGNIGGGRLSGFSDREWGWQMGAISRTYSPVVSSQRQPYKGYFTPRSERKRLTCEGIDDDDVGSVGSVESVSSVEVQPVAVSKAVAPGVGVTKQASTAVPPQLGYCYEQLIDEQASRDLAKRMLGPNPTLLSLLRLPASWFNDDWLVQAASCARVGPGAWHVGKRGVRVGLLLYIAAVPVRTFGLGELGRKLLEGPELTWSKSFGPPPAWSDTLGGTPSGATVFSDDPHGSKFKRLLNNPAGAVFHMAMHSASADIKPPEQIVMYRGGELFPVNTGYYGSEYPYKGMDGTTVRSAAVVPRIQSLDQPVKDFRVVVGKPPGAAAWAIEVSGVGDAVVSLSVPGLAQQLDGPTVWILTESEQVPFDVTLRGIAALSFHVVDFKASFGVVSAIGEGAYSVGY